MFSPDHANYPNTGRFLAGRLRHEMSEDERAGLETLVSEVKDHKNGDRLIARGDTCNHSTMLIEGFTLRTLEADDRRHGVSFHVPGDFIDLHCFTLKKLDHNIDCVGPVKVGLVPHEAIADVMKDKPHLARLLWFSTLLDAAMHREWIFKLERLTTPKRIAHIFAEIWRRLQMVGMGFDDGFETPLRQSDIADMCGATAIHTNRALSFLREEGIANFQRGEVRIKSRERLEAFAEFSQDYLYGDGDLSLAGDGIKAA
ncbi:Crp/Fnr family transcriptional regulator [Aurantiacibacter aquimixticola]|uniref:Crp/Fnr family transcriptional regulator n=2 Tax=Aurantiacibacter aquimixticola TaxID=1958945 RepID=A0A419RWR0_9SPHN|nr:Crp/Fnr family transcriptional regulator [Aurantiacibacter aquimixticola]